jgi:cation diffusion facilitator CzcD-associated flavoprotein CzcO/acetyl esterase/lipase
MEYDVIVIGAGFAGLYATHKLRDELGLNVRSFDAGGGPGGVWWWNRYPGARCDIESVYYSYSFSDEIQREWEWTERFASQPEIKAYLEFVADKLDLLRSFTFNTRIIATTWSDETRRWTVETDSGERHTARFVVAATGAMSIPKDLEIPGVGDFEGEVYETAAWPDKDVEYGGKRVAVIGTGASGVQVIQTLGPKVGHLTVFQRTANFCTPLGNRPIDEEERRWLAQNHETVRAGSRQHPAGTPYELLALPSSHAVTEKERRERYRQMLFGGGLRVIAATFSDILYDEKANEMLSDYVREHIAERVTRPGMLEKLMPRDHPYGTKRPPLEMGYFEVFNQDNVDLVDLRSEPILRITKNGIATSEREYEFDMIVLATGFDAGTGSFLRLNITGRNGLKLAEEWSQGPRNYLGLAMNGFPNLFTIAGPTAALALYNNPLALEDHGDLAAKAIQYCLDNHIETIEATRDAQDRWGQLAHDLLHLTLFPKTDSWYMGANVPGKPRSTGIFVAPAPLYRAFTAAMVEEGFAGFSADGKAKPYPGLLRMDARMSLVVAGGLVQGIPPLEACSIEQMRAMVEGMAELPGPVRNVEVTNANYPGGDGQEQLVRIYRPEMDGSLPVMLFFHGGGFVAGSVNAFDRRFRALAEDLGVVVIAPSYRLAPEDPFPAAVHDAFAALHWAAKMAGEYGGDASRLIVAGESAGGTLAAVTALRARDENGPPIAAQILITPAIADDADTPSRLEFADAPMLSTAALAKFWALYMPDKAKAQSPLASPGRAESLKGLPPTLILTAEIDPLRDEGEDYGKRLEQSGVDVVVTRINGLVHTSFNMEGMVPAAREYTRSMATFMLPLLVDKQAAQAAA